MNRLLISTTIAFQVLSVASIAISKEWVLATGEEVILQTAPIDPRDIFRGDYVKLDYLFSTIAVSQLGADILENGLNKGQQVYLSLKTGNSGIAQGDRLSLTPPASSLYLSGRVKMRWQPYQGYRKRSQADENQKPNKQPVQVKYGIEQYFVEQGQGIAMEKTRGSRNDFQVPMLMHVALADSGAGVIRSFDWANIALKTEIKQSPERDAPIDQASAIMSFTVKNRGNKDITLPWKPGNCSFNLLPIKTTPAEHGEITFEQTDCNSIKPVSRTLKPGEAISVDFDLNLPRWHIVYKQEKTPMGKLPWNYRFRIIYTGGAIKGINAKIISRAFHGRGNID